MKSIKKIRRSVVRMEGDNVVVANRLELDKERAAQIGIGVAVGAVVVGSAIAQSNRAPEDNTTLRNVGTAAGLVTVGALAATSAFMLEGMLSDRRNATRTGQQQGCTTTLADDDDEEIIIGDDMPDPLAGNNDPII